jgi:hypothetical protein
MQGISAQNRLAGRLTPQPAFQSMNESFSSHWDTDDDCCDTGLAPDGG